MSVWYNSGMKDNMADERLANLDIWIENGKERAVNGEGARRIENVWNSWKGIKVE